MRNGRDERKINDRKEKRNIMRQKRGKKSVGRKKEKTKG